MPQETIVLCCYSCKMFQVHILKKASKWQCKLCNEKQSLKQIYFQGSGKDCRLHVQQLNSLKVNQTISGVTSEQAEGDNSNSCNITTNTSQESYSKDVTSSKWTKYLDSSGSKSLFETEDFCWEDIHKTEDVK